MGHLIDLVVRENEGRRLRRFVVDGWRCLESNAPFVASWHIDAICEHLEAVSRGQIRNLVINMPPRHMKSLLVSVFWPCWDWTMFPERRFIYASYAQTLATRDSLKCRRLIRSAWYQRLYGNVFHLTGDQNQKMRFENDRTGYRISTSVGGIGTGEGGDRIVVDDPHNVLEAESKRVRTTALTWWDETMSSRGNDPKTSARIIVMQRVHEDDLTGHVLAQGGYEHLCLPAEYEGGRHVTSIGWSDPRKAIGDLLCADRFGREELAELKLRLGSRAAAGQLQQRPAPADGAIFKQEWFRNRYTKVPKFKRVASFWDTAIKVNQENDETACVSIGIGADGLPYILKASHGRWETPDVVAYLIEQSDGFRRLFGDVYCGDFVEDKVSGSTLMQYVKRERPDLPVIAVPAERDKIARAHGVTPICEAGRVLLPDMGAYPVSREWSNDLVTNLISFPMGAHDDLTDAFVYALRWYLDESVEKKVSRWGRGGMV